MSTPFPAGLHGATPAEVKARLDAERRGAPIAFFRDGDGRQRIVDLADHAPRVLIGRQPECSISLQWDGQVSRVHAELELIGTEWTVVDDGLSRNGTFVDNARIQGRRRLRDGDVVRVGRTDIHFRNLGHSRLGATLSPGASGTAPAPTVAQKRVLVALCRPFGESSFASPASNQQIARELFLSIDAVKTHLRALFAMFDVNELPQNAKRAALARAALEAGVVTAQDLASTATPPSA